MEAFLWSVLLVGMAEIGDKSLLLAILLSARYQRPWPVFWGLVAGISGNLALAAALGSLLAGWFANAWLGWVVGLSFLAMAIWSLCPEDDEVRPVSHGGLFMTAAVGFFLLEMADKTQLATAALAARFDNFLAVLAGGVLGVVAVNAPAIWLGGAFASRLPLQPMRIAAALLFTFIGIWVLLEASAVLG